MKKIALLVIVWFVGMPLCAQSVTKLLFQMNKLQREGKVLEAMDSATYVLTLDEDNLLAKNFVRHQWDQTMKETTQRLAILTDEQDLDQARERLILYKQLDEIHSNLRQIRMPLRGPNNSWVWQPEIGYFSGAYDSERVRTYRLILNKAEKALMSYDLEQARAYYDFALQYVLIEDERESNTETMLRQVNTRIEKLAESANIYERIVAYNLVDLSLWLDAAQTDKGTQKQRIQQGIAEMYLQRADEYAAAGDSISAAENRLLAEDWQVVTLDDGE